MPFKRFVIWCVERLFELQLAVLGVLAVKFLLPVHAESYTDLTAFVGGMRETWRAGIDDARFMTSAFMNGDGWFYAWKTYVASAWVVGFYLYLQSLYLFTSLWARQISDGRDTQFSIAAFLLSFVIFCGVFSQDHDAGSLRLALCLLFGGLAVVTVSAEFGKLLTGKPKRRSVGRTAQARGPDLSPSLTEAAAKSASYSVFRRKALYFSE